MSNRLAFVGSGVSVASRGRVGYAQASGLHGRLTIEGLGLAPPHVNVRIVLRIVVMTTIGDPPKVVMDAYPGIHIVRVDTHFVVTGPRT